MRCMLATVDSHLAQAPRSTDNTANHLHSRDLLSIERLSVQCVRTCLFISDFVPGFGRPRAGLKADGIATICPPWPLDSNKVNC